MGTEEELLTPIEDLKNVQIGPHTHQVTKMSTLLSAWEEREPVDQLRRNVNLFAWAPSDMPGIGIKVISHRLAIHPSSRPVVQRKWKVDKEKRVGINEEVEKLCNTRFITETKYST